MYASTAGCTAYSGTAFYYNGSAKFEGRISPVATSGSTDKCDTGWTRVFNNSSSSYLYISGSTRYGCSNYCYHQDVESGGFPPSSQAIAPGLAVFTPMVYPNSTMELLPCGLATSSANSTFPLGPSGAPYQPACGYVF